MPCQNCTKVGLFCEDCGSPHWLHPRDSSGQHDGYMVYSSLWKRFGVDSCHNWEGKPWRGEVSGNHRGILCLSCFEKRLGRKVTISDITLAPINNYLRKQLSAKGI